MIRLALRNIWRNGARLRPMVAILAVSFMLLLLGNAVMEQAGDAFYSAYSQNLAGDLSVMSQADHTYTLFGADILLVGEYLVPPVLHAFDELQAELDSMPQVRASAGVVSTAARVERGRRRQDMALFGVQFDEYARLFPALKISRGGYPEPGKPGIVLQQEQARKLRARVGQTIQLTVAYDNSFTIRAVPLTGIFGYPVEDELLNRVALVDADTARALNGYVYGAEEAAADISEEDLFASDDLFGQADDLSAAVSGDGEISLDDVEDFFATDDQDSLAGQARSDVWNHYLISLHSSSDEGKVRAALEKASNDAGHAWLVRDWRNTVGGSALLVWYLQVMMNAGLLFVALGAVIVTANALMLSVFERTKEIGTMRALGATRLKVTSLIALEVLFVMLASAALGLVLGFIAVYWLNNAQIVLSNQYLEILFGGQAIKGRITGGLLLSQLGAALLLAVLAMVYPLKRALGIGPARAMA